MKLGGKTVVIIGGANGIGEAAVRLFMDAGANVVIADYNEEAGMLLLNDLGPSSGERAFFVACNVADSASVQQLMEKTLKRFGAIEWTTGRCRAGLFCSLRPAPRIILTESSLK